MAEPEVEVATKALLRAWHREECDDLRLQFKPRGHHGDLIAVVARAVEVANDAFPDDDSDEDFVFGEGPWRVPVGPPAYEACLTRSSYEAGVVRWLDVFAGHLSAAGLAGTVRPAPTADDSSWSVVEQAAKHPQMTVFLAAVVLDPFPPRDRGIGWNVGEAATAQLAAWAAAAAFPGAETYLLSRGRLLRTEPVVAAAALRRTLPGNCVASVTHLRVQPPRVVDTNFYVNGMCARTVHDPVQHWADRLAQCTGAMVALAEAVDVAFVQHSAGIYGGWNGLLHGPPPLPGTDESDFRYNRHLLTRFVPDTRGAMVLTDAHLERAHDLSDWSVQALGHGRHLVQAADLADWFAQPEPAPEVLAAARADFGAMILTEADIPPRISPTPS